MRLQISFQMSRWNSAMLSAVCFKPRHPSSPQCPFLGIELMALYLPMSARCNSMLSHNLYWPRFEPFCLSSITLSRNSKWDLQDGDKVNYVDICFKYRQFIKVREARRRKGVPKFTRLYHSIKKCPPHDSQIISKFMETSVWICMNMGLINQNKVTNFKIHVLLRFRHFLYVLSPEFPFSFCSLIYPTIIISENENILVFGRHLDNYSSEFSQIFRNYWFHCNLLKYASESVHMLKQLLIYQIVKYNIFIKVH
ncbi:hypothetical protein GQR58_002402 [Nymphon striatum]|nr:hypothetical protein GQR58_002402 [Nymphon striatum]